MLNRFFQLQFLSIIAGPSMGDENHTKKIENVGLIFSAAIFVTPTHRRTLEFAILNLHKKFLGIYMSQISNLRVAQLRGGEVNKNRSQKKSKMSAWRSKQTFKVWTKQVAWPGRQTSSCSVQPLHRFGQATCSVYFIDNILGITPQKKVQRTLSGLCGGNKQIRSPKKFCQKGHCVFCHV